MDPADVQIHSFLTAGVAADVPPDALDLVDPLLALSSQGASLVNADLVPVARAGELLASVVKRAQVVIAVVVKLLGGTKVDDRLVVALLEAGDEEAKPQVVAALLVVR